MHEKFCDEKGRYLEHWRKILINKLKNLITNERIFQAIFS